MDDLIPNNTNIYLPDFTETITPVAPTMPPIEKMSVDIKKSAELTPQSYSTIKTQQDSFNSQILGGDKRAKFENYDTRLEDAYVKLNSGNWIAKYENYIPGTNNDERLAQGQSTGSKWWNGIQKLGGKIATSAVGGTVGSVIGAIEGISKGSLSAVYDNSFNDWLDDLNTKMDYNLPNYYTEQEKNKSLLGQSFTANFWANDVMGGLSFTLGMIVSEGVWAYATGGTSLFAKGALGQATRWSTKALGAERAMGALSKSKNIGKALLNDVAEKKAFDVARNATIKGAKATEFLNNTRLIYTSAAYEGGVEARHYMKETEEQYISDYMAKYGKKPSVQELDNFRKGLVNSANAVFATNIALVGSSNLAIYGKMLLGSKNTGTFTNNWFKKNVLGVGYEKVGADGTIKAIEQTARQKVGSKFYDVLRPVFLEGFYEEGGQGTIAKAAKAYTLSGYDMDNTKDSLGIAESMWEGFKETYGTKEGGKEVFIGAIIGLIGGGISGNFSQTSDQRKAVDDLVDYRNTFTAKNLFNNIIYTNKAKSANEMSEQALKNGDIVGGKIGNDMATTAKIERDYAFEGVEQGAKDYRAYLYTRAQELQEELGLDEDGTKQFIEEKVNEYKQLADEYVKNREFAEAAFGTREFAEFRNAGIARDVVVRAVANNLTIGKNADNLATATINDIKEQSLNILSNRETANALDVSDALRKVNKTAIKDYRQKSQQLSVLEERYKKIQDRIAKINSTRQENETEASERARLVEQFNELAQEVQRAQAQKQASYNALNLRGVSEEMITQDDLDNQEKNLQELVGSIESLSSTDPTAYARIKTKLKEYERAVEYARTYNTLAQKMVDPSLRMTEINGYVQKLFSKNKSLEEGELAFFQNIVENYTQDNIAEVTKTQEDGAPIETEPVEETMEAPPIQTKTDNQSKINKINKRRQEELEKESPFKNKFVKNNPNGDNIDLTESEYKRVEALINKWIKQGLSAEDIYIKLIDNNIRRKQVDASFVKDWIQDKIDGKTKLKAGESVSDEINAKYDAEINALENNTINKEQTEQTDPIQKIIQQIKQMIQGNSYTKEYKGEEFDELLKSKPSQKDIDKYTGYIQRMSQPTTDPEQLKAEGFNEQEIEDFTKLNRKLGNWNVLDGVTVEGNSIVDLLQLIEQYQTQLDKQDTKTELTQQDYLTVQSAPDVEMSTYDTARPVQTPDNVKVKSLQSTYQISHLDITSLPQYFEGSILSEKNAKGELVPIDTNNIKEQGRKFVLQLPTGESVEFTIGQSARITVGKEQMNTLLESTDRIKIVDYGDKSSFDIYEKVGDEYIPLQGDFGYGENQLNKELVDRQKPGDKISLQVDTNDNYNKKLIDNYQRAKKSRAKNKEEKLREAEKQLKENLHIFVTTENGEILGSFKAFQQSFNANSEATQTLLALRERATRNVMDGKSGRFDMNVSIPIEKVLIGSPNYKVKEGENNSLVPTTQKFTPEMMKKVVAVGYVKNGELKLNKKIEAEKMFVQKFSEKTPIIVFDYNGRNIAFPVSLIKTEVDLTRRIVEIGNLNVPVSQQIKHLNEFLVQNGVSPSEYIFDPSQALTSDGNIDTLTRLFDRFEKINEFADIETWINEKFNVSLLQQQAEIAIDISNRPFNTGKMILDLENVEQVGELDILKGLFEGSETEKLNLEKSLSQDMQDIYQDWLTNPAYQDMTEGRFVDAMDGTDVQKEPNNALETMSNVNMLKEVIKIMPKKVRDNIGQSKIGKIREQIARHEQLEKELGSLKAGIKNQTVAQQVKDNKPKVNNCN